MIRVGAAGWVYRDWDGIVYPARKRKGFEALEYLQRFTDCVEINSSFYATPRAENAVRWAQQTRRPDAVPAFHFSAKLQQAFTHGPVLAGQELEAASAAFSKGLEPLRSSGRLAALLAQFPVTFHHTLAGEERLVGIKRSFPGWPMAVELRHKSWFTEAALRFLESAELSLLHIDLPAARDHPPARFRSTGPIGYLRLHGRNAQQWFKKGAGRDQRYDYLYEPREIEELHATALELAEEHDEVYIVSNNHFEGQAVANAIELRARLVGERVPAPAELMARYPRLGERAESVGQQELF